MAGRLSAAPRRRRISATSGGERLFLAENVGRATSLSAKKFAQAHEHLATYDRLLPGNQEVLFFLGYSLEHMDRKEEAARRYTAYLQKQRQGEQAQHAASRLKEWGYSK